MITVMEWINANYGLIIFAAIILAMAGYSFYKKQKQKKEMKLAEQSYPLSAVAEMDLFEDVIAGDSLSSFKKQKLVAEKNISQIKKEAKQVVVEEKKIDYEYRQKKLQFANEKKRLGLSYTNYMHQSRIIDEMMQNQIKMQEEFNKAKDGN